MAASSALPLRAGVVREIERNLGRFDGDDGLECGCLMTRFRHHRVEPFGPTVPGRKSSHDAPLHRFMPRDAVAAAPCGDPLIPREGPRVSGLLVGPERRDLIARPEVVENIFCGARADHEGLP